MKIDKLKSLLISAYCIVTALWSEPQCMEQKVHQFESIIFTYDDLKEAKNLHVSLKGANWEAKEAKEQDIPFYQQLFTNPQVMERRTLKSTEERLRDLSIYRFQNGQPHGSLTVFNPENQEKFGYVIAGIGDEPGVSGIGYSYLPEYWGKKIGSGVVGEIVQKWAPDVRRIGLGKNLDELQDSNIIKAFKCFGGKELCRLEGSARISNTGSWKIFDKCGFNPAEVKVQNEEAVVDLDNKDIESFEALEEHILKLFDVSTNTPLKAGIMYRLIDTEGKVKTFRNSEAYDRQGKGIIGYHFELKVE